MLEDTTLFPRFANDLRTASQPHAKDPEAHLQPQLPGRRTSLKGTKRTQHPALPPSTSEQAPSSLLNPTSSWTRPRTVPRQHCGGRQPARPPPAPGPHRLPGPFGVARKRPRARPPSRKDCSAMRRPAGAARPGPAPNRGPAPATAPARPGPHLPAAPLPPRGRHGGGGGRRRPRWAGRHSPRCGCLPPPPGPAATGSTWPEIRRPGGGQAAGSTSLGRGGRVYGRSPVTLSPEQRREGIV